MSSVQQFDWQRYLRMADDTFSGHLLNYVPGQLDEKVVASAVETMGAESPPLGQMPEIPRLRPFQLAAQQPAIDPALLSLPEAVAVPGNAGEEMQGLQGLQEMQGSVVDEWDWPEIKQPETPRSYLARYDPMPAFKPVHQMAPFRIQARAPAQEDYFENFMPSTPESPCPVRYHTKPQDLSETVIYRRQDTPRPAPNAGPSAVAMLSLPVQQSARKPLAELVNGGETAANEIQVRDAKKRKLAKDDEKPVFLAEHILGLNWWYVDRKGSDRRLAYRISKGLGDDSFITVPFEAMTARFPGSESEIVRYWETIIKPRDGTLVNIRRHFDIQRDIRSQIAKAMAKCLTFDEQDAIDFLIVNSMPRLYRAGMSHAKAAKLYWKHIGAELERMQGK